MKKLTNAVIALAIVMTQACITDTGSSNNFNQTAQTTTTGTDTTDRSVMLIVIADRSKSYEFGTIPEPTLFKSLIDKLSQSTTVDVRYGVIRDFSNTTFDRYFKPYVSPVTTEEGNPWMDKKEGPVPAPAQRGDNWNQFVSSVQAKLSAPPSKASDIVSAIRHALVAFSENHSSHTRKILFLCTDYMDSFSELPAIPGDVEIISVGVLPAGQSVSDILHYNGSVRTFENQNAAIDYLLSQNF